MVPPASGLTFYTIRDKVTGNVTLYLDFALFSNGLGALLAQGATLSQFVAVGPYTAGTNTVEASLASAVVQ